MICFNVNCLQNLKQFSTELFLFTLAKFTKVPRKESTIVYTAKE